MNRETVEQLLKLIDKENTVETIVLGGAPELNPHFRFFGKRIEKSWYQSYESL